MRSGDYCKFVHHYFHVHKKCAYAYQHHKHQCSSSDADIHNIFLLDTPYTEFLHRYLPHRCKCLLGMLSSPILYLADSNNLLGMAAH